MKTQRPPPEVGATMLALLLSNNILAILMSPLYFETAAPDNTFATTTVQNLDNNVQMFEKAAGISDSLFYNELPKEPAVNECKIYNRCVSVKKDELHFILFFVVVCSAFSSRNVKKRNESNRGQVFKKILKSPQPTGIKKPKLVDGKLDSLTMVIFYEFVSLALKFL